VGMGKPTRNELLAEYYLRAAGVVAVWIDATGHVGAQDVASIENEPDRTVYCCERGAHFVLAYRLYEWKKAVEVDLAAIATKLEELADRGGVRFSHSFRTVVPPWLSRWRAFRRWRPQTFSADLRRRPGEMKRSRSKTPALRRSEPSGSGGARSWRTCAINDR
jgi:hypothetical protein